jgi:hypothetical protein
MANETRYVRCWLCKQTHGVTAPEEQFKAFDAGELAQRAFVGMSQSDRELLISQTCSDCFDSLFEGEED